MPTNDEDTIPALSSSPRCRPLWDWLLAHDATCFWQQEIKGYMGDIKRVMAKIECWRVGKGLVLVMINRHGWSVFTEPNTSDIEATLGDAEIRVGIAKPETYARELDRILNPYGRDRDPDDRAAWREAFRRILDDEGTSIGASSSMAEAVETRIERVARERAEGKRQP